MNPDEDLQNSGEHREQGLGSRHGWNVWVLWVLASTVGGGAAGTTFNLEFVGLLVLFGAVLGTVQALVVWRYMGGLPGIRWLAASALGWLAGWYVLGIAKLALLSLAPDLLQRPSYEQIVVLRLFNEPIVWAVFGAFQYAVLLPILRLALGRRSSRFFAALWILASALGGALVVVASFALDATVLPSGDGNSFWGVILPQAVAQATGGALYGAVTGIVFARIVQKKA